MNELCIPKTCQCDGCTKSADIGLVEILDADGNRRVGALSQFLRRTGKRRKLIKVLKIGYQFVRWHYYCADHHHDWLNGNRDKNQQRETL